MEVVSNRRKAVFRELLAFCLQEAERYLADERCPARVAAERTGDAVAEGERVEVENGSRGLLAEAAAAAAFKDVQGEVLVGADEEAHAAVGVQLPDA